MIATMDLWIITLFTIFRHFSISRHASYLDTPHSFGSDLITTVISVISAIYILEPSPTNSEEAGYSAIIISN